MWTEGRHIVPPSCRSRRLEGAGEVYLAGLPRPSLPARSAAPACRTSAGHRQTPTESSPEGAPPRCPARPTRTPTTTTSRVSASMTTRWLVGHRSHSGPQAGGCADDMARRLRDEAGPSRVSVRYRQRLGSRRVGDQPTSAGASRSPVRLVQVASMRLNPPMAPHRRSRLRRHGTRTVVAAMELPDAEREADVVDQTAVMCATHEGEEEQGQPCDVLITSAGQAVRPGPLRELPDEILRQMIEVNHSRSSRLSASVNDAPIPRPGRGSHLLRVTLLGPCRAGRRPVPSGLFVTSGRCGAVAGDDIGTTSWGVTGTFACRHTVGIRRSSAHVAGQYSSRTSYTCGHHAGLWNGGSGER